MQNRSATEDATDDFKPNGNGHAKAFSIGPSRDAQERTLKILSIRRKIFEWPRRRKSLPGGLSDSEKFFFGWLLDLSLHPEHNERDGVIVASEEFCAGKLGVCATTIWRWKWNLIRITGELWL